MQLRIKGILKASCLVLFFNIAAVNTVVSQFNPFQVFKGDKSLTYGLNNKISSFLDQPATQYGLHLGVNFGNKFKHTVTVNSTFFWVGKLAPMPNEIRQVRITFFGFSEEFSVLETLSFENFFFVEFQSLSHWRMSAYRV